MNTKAAHHDFESYMQQLDDGFYLTCNTSPCPSEHNSFAYAKDTRCRCELEFDFEELRQLWREHSQANSMLKTAIVLLLQFRLQPVLENLILLDRIVYLNEKGLTDCRVKKIFDDQISPRCYALVAVK